MKHIFLLIGMLCGLLVNAQKVLHNAIVKAKMETQRESSGESEGMMMMGGGETTIQYFIKDSLSKVVVNTSFFNSIVLNDRSTGTVTNLTEAQGEKTGYTTTAADRLDQKRIMDSVRKAREESGEDAPAPGRMVVRMGGPTTVKNISYKEETKVINGINCKKALVTVLNQEKEESEIAVWFTEDYALPNGVQASRGGAMQFTGLKGMPIEYIMVRKMNMMGNEITMTTTYQVTEIKTDVKLEDKEFEVPKGYKVKPYSQWIKENPDGMPMPVRTIIRG